MSQTLLTIKLASQLLNGVVVAISRVNINRNIFLIFEKPCNTNLYPFPIRVIPIQNQYQKVQDQKQKPQIGRRTMKRALLINLSHYTRNHLLSSTTPIYNNNNATFITKPLLSLSLDSSKFRFFSSENEDSSSAENPNPPRETSPSPSPETSLVASEKKQLPDADAEDISNKGNPQNNIFFLKERILINWMFL